MTSTATNVLVSEPIRYWVSPSGSCPSVMLRAPHQACRPSRTTAATSDGARPSAWPTATRWASARRVAGNSSSGTPGGVEAAMGSTLANRPRRRPAPQSRRQPQAARRRTSQTVAAMSSTDSASSQPPSIHWKGQNRLPGW